MAKGAFDEALAKCGRVLSKIPRTDKELIEWFGDLAQNPNAVHLVTRRAEHPNGRFARRCMLSLAARLCGGYNPFSIAPPEEWPDRDDQHLRDVVSESLRYMSTKGLKAPAEGKRGRFPSDHCRDMTICALVEMVHRDHGLHRTSNKPRVQQEAVRKQCRAGGSACDVVRLALHEVGVELSYKRIEHIVGKRKEIMASSFRTSEGLRDETEYSIEWQVCFEALMRATPEAPLEEDLAKIICEDDWTD